MSEIKCVCLLGVDGSGKSTLADAYLSYVKKKKVPSVHVWSRYRNYLSKPFLGLMRITGHNRKVTIDGIKIGIHDFSNNRLIAGIFLGLQWVDQYIDISLRFRNRKMVIVSDRCVADTLVDLCVDTGMDDFIFGTYGRSLISLMPKDSVYCVILREKSLVLKTRPDVAADGDYERRVELYHRIATIFGFSVVINDGPIQDSVKEIVRVTE